MKIQHLQYLACPQCAGDLEIASIGKQDGNSIQEGLLECVGCGATFDIMRYVPRFVPMDNYAAGFGYQWNRHAKTQYDSHSGTKISEERWFAETQWPRNLEGEKILEVGCGAGRFTEIAASTNAMVISLDYSSAVDANYASHGNRDNVLIVQGDIYRMPFKRGFFERIFCLGVLQHTPDVKKAFFSLPPFLKPGGRLAIDVYRYRWWKKIVWTRYWIRPLTKRMPVRTLYKFCDRYVRFMWPLCRLIRRLPGGRIFNRLLVIADHGGDLPLSDDQLKEWAILDTFDWLAPAFDKPQSLETVHSWFRAAGLANVDVRPGYNGIEGRGSVAGSSTNGSAPLASPPTSNPGDD